MAKNDSIWSRCDYECKEIRMTISDAGFQSVRKQSRLEYLEIGDQPMGMCQGLAVAWLLHASINFVG